MQKSLEYKEKELNKKVIFYRNVVGGIKVKFTV